MWVGLSVQVAGIKDKRNSQIAVAMRYLRNIVTMIPWMHFGALIFKQFMSKEMTIILQIGNTCSLC